MKFENLPANIRNEMIKSFSCPVLIELKPDGTLDVDSADSTVDYILRISNALPPIPNLKDIVEEEVRKEARVLYSVMAVYKILPFFQSTIDEMQKEGKTSMEIKQKLSEYGTDIQLIFNACTKKFTLEQIKDAQWGKYPLTYEEALSLESVGLLRSEINSRRSNYETSKAYLSASKVEIAIKTEEFEHELDMVTNDLWRILHMGANHLTAKERLLLDKKIKEQKEIDEEHPVSQDPTLRKMRESYVQEDLIRLRIAYLEKWRREGKDFVFPKPKS
jgi:hypothetical protein